MEKAILSRIDLSAFDSFTAIEYKDMISDLLQTPEVQELDLYTQHLNTSRFQHSLNVSYYSFIIAKFFHLDARSAARGGLLHDLFFYDWCDSGLSAGAHSKEHPLIALDNARKITKLNKVEEDVIVKHMWPLTPTAPKYLESYIVTMVDKYCATAEVFGMTFKKFSRFSNFAFGAKGI